MEYYVFYSGDKELLAISVYGSFQGEIEDTKKLLAYEHKISPDDITVKIEKRKRKGSQYEIR